MEIIITEWALDSYLDLKGKQAFSDVEYRKSMRPDVLLLKNYPADPKFGQNKFWSEAQDSAKLRIPNVKRRACNCAGAIEVWNLEFLWILERGK